MGRWAIVVAATAARIRKLAGPLPQVAALTDFYEVQLLKACTPTVTDFILTVGVPVSRYQSDVGAPHTVMRGQG